MKTFSTLLALLVTALPLCAQEIEINVETRLEPTQAVGIVLSSRGPVQVPGVKTERLAENLLIAKVPLPPAIDADAMVTVMIVDAQGKTAYGNVRPAKDVSDSFYNIPMCTPEKVSNASLQNQMSVLEQLVDVRAQRRGVAQLKVTQILSGDFLGKLRSIERSFGLPNDPELAPNMRPAELNDRLSRLLAAIQTVGATTSRQQNQKSKP